MCVESVFRYRSKKSSARRHASRRTCARRKKCGSPGYMENSNGLPSFTNVAFHDTLSLVDTLVKLGKPFEFSMYPGEPHFFRRAYVLRDAWRRAEEFFDRHLKTDAPHIDSF